MNELIQVAERQIGDGTIQTVNARDLHAFLGVGKDFSTWVNDRIQQYGFVENQDFVIDSPGPGNQSGRGGDRRSKDYHLTLNMAKELAMVERNNKGKQARQYFIECQRRAKANVIDITTTLADPANLTMSSREIANLTDKRHADVMRDIRNMLGQLELQADEYAQNCADPQNGQMYPVFNLPKDLTLTLVAGYNVKLRKRIIDRWLELEAKVGAGGTAIPQTLPEALRLAADLAEQKAKAEAQLAIAAPKVHFHDAVSEAINCQSVQEIAKVLGTGPNRLFKFLRDEGLLMRDNLPYQQYLDAGYFRVVEKQYNDGRGESHAYTRTLVTGKGLAYIQKRLQNQNNILQESPA